MAYTDKEYFASKLKSEDIINLYGDSAEILNPAIQSADSLINTYLNNVLEDTSVILQDSYCPPIIRQCSYDIAIFYLHDRIQYSEIPQWVKDKYNAAIDFLTKVAKGIISLDIETGDTDSPFSHNVQYFGNNTVMERGSF